MTLRANKKLTFEFLEMCRWLIGGIGGKAKSSCVFTENKQRYLEGALEKIYVEQFFFFLIIR